MKYLVITFILISIIGINCTPFDKEWSISIKNKSQQAIYVYANYILPDTALPVIKPAFIQVPNGKVTIGSIYDFSVQDPEFKRLDKDRLTVFILNKDSIDKYDWDSIRTNYMVLKRFEFNAQELRNMGGEIIYP